MKKVLISLISIVLIVSMMTGCPTTPNYTEQELAAVALVGVIYVWAAELYYESATPPVPGMTGTSDMMNNDVAVQWDNFDLAAVDDNPDTAPGEVILTGSHTISVSGTTLTNNLDVTMEIDGESFHVIMQTKTHNLDLENEYDENIKIEVNGVNVINALEDL